MPRTRHTPSQRGKPIVSETNAGSDYTDDESEWLKAMDELKRRRPFPTCCEVLAVAKSLGYRKEK